MCGHRWSATISSMARAITAIPPFAIQSDHQCRNARLFAIESGLDQYHSSTRASEWPPSCTRSHVLHLCPMFGHIFGQQCKIWSCAITAVSCSLPIGGGGARCTATGCCTVQLLYMISGCRQHSTEMLQLLLELSRDCAFLLQLLRLLLQHEKQ